MSDDNSRIMDFLYRHPKLIGLLFTAVLLMSQVGTVAAGASKVVKGP